MIHVDKLTKFYGDFRAVDHISIDIHKGEIVGLLGPNGAGKTTTLKMLTGYFLPTEGDIRVMGLTISENPLKIKQKIGYLPESSPFYKDMLVYDYLTYVAKMRGIPTSKRHARLKYLSGLCSLSGIMHKSIGELSKGLNQRVGLAHAMMSDPEILVLDEPTQGLDPNQIVEIRGLIKKIGQEKTVIFSTHILSEAEATCDRIIIINNGKIVADGKTEEIREHAGKGAVLHVTLANADFESVRLKLESVSGVASVNLIEKTDDGIISVTLACPTAEDPREAVYLKIRSTDWILLNFNRKKETLESVFHDLTRTAVN